MGTEISSEVTTRTIKENELKKILKPGEVGAILEIIVHDKDGKVTERREIKSKSFVRQFLELLYVVAYQLSQYGGYSYTTQDTGNNTRAIYGLGSSNFAVIAGAGDVNYGIIIGTGSTAPTINDYHIQTIIPHATMNYGGVTFGLPTSDSTTSQFTITRNFANVSGGSVTVNEIALYVQGLNAATTYYYFMTIRDVISGGIVVPNGQTLTVNYRLQAVI